MHKQTIKYFGVFTSIILAIYITASITINFEALYTKLRNQLAEAGYDAKTKSVEVSHFPFPTVNLSDIDIPGIFYAKKVSAKFSIFSILTFNPTINLVEASDIKIYTTGTTIASHEYPITQIFKLLPKIPDINFSKILLFDKKTNSYDSLKSIKIRPNSRFNNVTMYWSDDKYTNISYKQSDKIQVKISTVGQYHSIELLENYDTNLKMVDGTLNYNISSLKDHMMTDYKNFDLLITQIISKEPVKITSTFQLIDKGLALNDLNISSNSIEMSGSGNISDNTANILNLHFKKINLTNLLQTPTMNSITLSKNKKELNIASTNSTINASADTIDLNGMTISNAKLIASNDGTKFNINECSGNIQKSGSFEINGNITQNQYRSEFNGKVKIIDSDANHLLSKFEYLQNIEGSYPMSIKSDVVATPIDYKLTNLQAQIGKLSGSGSAAIKLVGSSPRINLAMNFSSIDFSKNDYIVVSPIIDYFRTLNEDMNNTNYLNKYIPLRKIGYLGNFDITLTNSIINGKNIDKIHFLCQASPGMLDFSSLYYKNGTNYFLGNAQLISKGLKPLLTLRINDGEIYANNLSPDSILSTIIEANSKYAFDKITLDFAIELKKLEQNNLKISNFYIAAINQDKLFNISALQGIYNTGVFTSSGNIFLEKMILNLAYSYNNFNMNDINIIYPVSIFGIKDGWASTNGTISTNGDTIAKILYNLYTKSELVASNIEISNMDLDNIATTVSSPNYDTNNIIVDAKSSLSRGNTLISTATGGYEIEHGIIKFPNITFSTKNTSNTLTTSYNIYDTNIDSILKTTFSQPPKEKYSQSIPINLTIHTHGKITSPQQEITYDSPTKNNLNKPLPFNPQSHINFRKRR